MPDPAPLPIDAVLPAIRGALETSNRLVIQAPTGAGKTTRVPLALLDAPWSDDGRIVMLEPRRLAARASARRMAASLGEQPGQMVGYATRDERQVGPRTRIEVVTEGILVRRLQRDPSLAGTAAVLFDEFHERSLHADLGLALALESQQVLREDLRIAVMSATLDGERIAALLDGCPVVVSEGRQFPVETRYLGVHGAVRTGREATAGVATAVVEALAATDGDVLVFLPGAREIRRAASDLAAERSIGRDVLVAPLYGALPPREQDRALDPAPAGRRKVVLATDIAETSLTIAGIRAVVDAGLARAPRFDARTGMSRLETVRVSRASADQRRGRAGRTAPGLCLRLWSEREHAALDPFTAPGIVQSDLAGFALDLASWGATDPADLHLLDPPPAPAYAAALELLTGLEAIDHDGRITEHGAAMAAIPAHPRIAHMMLRAGELDLAGLACDAAAVLADRDLLTTSWDSPHADLASRIRVLRGADPPAGTRVRGGAIKRARREAQRLRRSVSAGSVPGSGSGSGEVARLGLVLAFAYPDRIAQRRGRRRGTFVLSNGRGASLPEADVLSGEAHLVVADVDRGAQESRIYLAAAITLDEIELAAGSAVVSEDEVAWDRDAGAVVAEHRERLGRLVLRRHPLPEPDPVDVTAALLDGVRAEGLELLRWSRAARELRERLGFLHRALGEPWPDVGDDALLADLERWLGPFLAGRRRRGDLGGVPLIDALRSRLDWKGARDLDQLAPTHLAVPSGSRVRLDYGPEGPVLAVRLQEMFGAVRTPTVAGGRVPVTVHLLSPARRPLQVTQDLPGFWERGYPEVRGEMRGRYPKHYWPEDPLTAQATARVRPRKDR